MRILHVAESWGGGTASSLLAMVDATPQIEHHLLARTRSDSAIGGTAESAFASVTPMARGPLAAARQLRALADRLAPDAVHAHSSIAGTLVRAVRPPGTRVVFTAHGFAFDRRDITRVQRAGFERVERSLVRRTDLVVAISPREVEAAAALGHAEVAHVPNRAVLSTASRARFAPRLRIVTVGRVTPAKDWHYFVHLKRYAERQLGIDADWAWLGGGDADGETDLRRAGIEVSGWLDHAEILERTAAAQAYVHTAAWESAPMSVLEAAALRLPLVLRSIPQLEALRLPGLGRSVPDMAERIQALQAPLAWVRAQAESDELTRRHDRVAQGEALLDAYHRVCGRSGGDRTDHTTGVVRPLVAVGCR